MKTDFKHSLSAGLLGLMLQVSAAAWGQDTNKFSLSTRMFLSEWHQQSEQAAAGPSLAPERGLSDDLMLLEPERTIASPVTRNGVPYISCFIHLSNPTDLSAVRALGVQVQESFDGLDFITAEVPVSQLEALADIENVTLITVAELMRPMTDVAREKTGVDYLLTNTAAVSRGLSGAYDGSGVVLGVIDLGIDFRHIAFKDAAGNYRLKRAYVWDGDTAILYTEAEIANPATPLTTDDNTQDHGTHTSSTAGGSSVIVSKTAQGSDTVIVTNDHANATYGGMAPGTDLYLAGVKRLVNTYMTNALQDMVRYADSVGKPLVVSNSWGGTTGPRDGKCTWADLVGQYFGDAHPNHIILFASANAAGQSSKGEGGGYFVKKDNAIASAPLGTIIRSRRYGNTDGGFAYVENFAYAWCADTLMNGILYVLDTTGVIVHTDTITESKTFPKGIFKVNSPSDTTKYYTGDLHVWLGKNLGQYELCTWSNYGLETAACDTTFLPDNSKTFKSHYTLAIEVYPVSGTHPIRIWGGNYSYFTDGSPKMSTFGHTWLAGNDDFCVSDEALIPDAISIGAYVSKTHVTNSEGTTVDYSVSGEMGDIAKFSSYALASLTPSGEVCPWITAPGAQLVAGVNHHHTDSSGYYILAKGDLVVNSASNPYAAMQGTSMATPTAAGIVALWLQAAKSVGKSLTVNQVKDIMKRTAVNDYFTTIGPNASHFGNGKIDALAGIRLITGNALEIVDTAYNDMLISRNQDSTANVMLYGRTLYKDGDWNTLCLPFPLTLSGSVLDGAEARSLTDASLSDDTLTLTFSDPVSTLTAGTPYIIKWASGEDLVNPMFTGVTISASAPAAVTSSGVSFRGTYSQKAFDATDTSVLMVGVGNTLYYPRPGARINACRAYFDLSGSAAAAPARIVFNLEGEGNATDLQHMGQAETAVKFWQNGQLYIRRGGIVYDAMGRRVLQLNQQ